MIVPFKRTTYLTVRKLFNRIYLFRVMNICRSMGLSDYLIIRGCTVISEHVVDNITYI